MQPPDDWEPTGETDFITYDEYWCPSEKNWTGCPGPCPDGTKHGVKTKRSIDGDVYVSPSTPGARMIRHSSKRVDFDD